MMSAVGVLLAQKSVELSQGATSKTMVLVKRMEMDAKILMDGDEAYPNG